MYFATHRIFFTRRLFLDEFDFHSRATMGNQLSVEKRIWIIGEAQRQRNN